MELTQLQPEQLWANFSALNAIPRASKKEEKVIEFMRSFGTSLNLDTRVDAAGNVVIKKPATPGMENRQTVILQSHLDMVHQKNNDTEFDFDTQGIQMHVDGDWVRAKGTTLGADNGMGVAAIMTILAATDIEHPALEAMFTIDEETGMTGAKNLDPSNFSGTILLNLDTEEDDELTIGCAGGVDTNTSYDYEQVTAASDGIGFTLRVKGLTGGHSGMDIHKGRGNANKLMNRLLQAAMQSTPVQLSSIDGGSLRNAIPRESTAIVVVPAADKLSFLALVDVFATVLKEEYATVEPGLLIEVEECACPDTVVSADDFKKIVTAVYAAANGVFRMSPDISNLVEASSNLARVIVKDGKFITQSLQRSSVESSKEDVANAVGAAFENMGCVITRKGDYPGWKPNPDSTILRLMESLYEDTFKSKPKVEACHAGLECGILSGHLGSIDMVSFGPTIRGAHSPNECVQVSSVQKFWTYLLAVLREIPTKG